MKLLACHIENFGKLSDLSFDFEDGINVINQSNAWGKSTLAAFLKAMFYGLDAKKEAKAFEKERVLYRPWQGGVFGGELDFEMEGKSYRISRTFGRTEKTDEFHLYDLATNLECLDYSDQIGTEIFDLDSGSFKRTIYIAQNDCVGGVSDRINAKLGNLAENTDDINNFESASRHLKDILNQLTPDRVTGSIKKRKNYIARLTQELRAFEAAQQGLEGLRRKEQVVSSQIEELMGIRQNYAQALVVASEESRKQELRMQYDALCKDVDEKEEKVNALKAFFPNGVPQKEEFKAQMQFVRNMENKKAQLKGLELTAGEHETWKGLEAMFEAEVPTVKQIEASLETLASIDKQKENFASLEMHMHLLEKELKEEPEEPVFERLSHKIPLFSGVGIALVGLAALALWFMNMIPVTNDKYLLIAIICTILFGGVFVVIGALQGSRAKKEREAWRISVNNEKANVRQRYDELKGQANSLKEHINQVHGTVGTFLERFHVYCKVDEYSAKLYEMKNQLAEYERLTEKISESMNTRKEFESELQKIRVFTEEYGYSESEDLSSVINSYQEKATEYHLAQQAYAEAYKKRENFEKRQDKSFWTKEGRCPYGIDELNQMIQQADAKLEELKTAKAQYTKQLEDLQEQLDLRDEKQAELGEQLYQQEKDTKRYTIIKLTQEYLTKAKEQFTARYMDPIANGFSKYYQMLTGDDSNAWVIDANINLKMKEQGELRDTRWLSAGYQDLLGVCMRLALVDTMYKEEKPFLILDDPFVNLDKEKVEAGNQLLLEVAKEYQVIYFTCHDSRNPRK